MSIERLILSTEPLTDSQDLAVPTSGVLNRPVAGKGPASPPPSALVKKLRAIKKDPAVRFVMHMDDFAADYYLDIYRLWFKQMNEAGDLSPLGDQLLRWVRVAGLLALGCDRVITPQVLMVARDVAVDDHNNGVTLLKVITSVLDHLKQCEAAEKNVHRIH